MKVSVFHEKRRLETAAHPNSIVRQRIAVPSQSKSTPINGMPFILLFIFVE